MLHHTEFHFRKIEQTPHQSDIEYTSFAATSLIHPYMTSMTKMLNAFCSKRCTWCWFATKPHLFCKGHYITLLGPAWGKIVNNPVWFAAVCCLDGLMLPVHYKRRKMKIYTSYSLQLELELQTGILLFLINGHRTFAGHFCFKSLNTMAINRVLSNVACNHARGKHHVAGDWFVLSGVSFTNLTGWDKVVTS